MALSLTAPCIDYLVHLFRKSYRKSDRAYLHRLQIDGLCCKNFKLIIIVNALATKANFMMGKTHIFYLFYL